MADEQEPMESPVRDRLALIRTQLANERTLLSYVRTSIMFAATGGTLLKLFWGEWFAFLAGWLSLALAVGVAVVGVKRFASLRSSLNKDR